MQQTMGVSTIMLGLAGVLANRHPDDIHLLVDRMAGLLSHRGNGTILSSVFDNGQSAVISCHSIANDNYVADTGIQGLLIVDGLAPQSKGINSLDEIMNPALTLPPEEVTVMAQSLGLSECFALSVTDEGLSAIRLPFSMIPLYFCMRDGLLTFASERKCLWTLESPKVQALQPGEMLFVSRDSRLQRTARALRAQPTVGESLSKQSLIKELALRLMARFESIRGREIGVLFSGGVDSSLAALLANDICNRVTLYTSRSEDSHDRRVAYKSAKAIGLNLVEVEIDPDVVWEVLPSVIWATESSKLMDVEIALPFFLAARRASDDGLTLMVSGQGPDELFAGYSRHLRIYQEEGPIPLALNLWDEMSMTHEVNIERDERAIAFHGVQAFFPYLESRFVRLALAVPVEWKICPGETPSRKIVFRELARHLGLPETIATIPKRATQYSSGSSRALQEAVSRQVKKASDLGKKKLVALTQAVLNLLSHDMGFPVEKPSENIEFRTEPTLPSLRE